ncbi:CoA-binding protein [Meiothermus taiwanensis]|uniref:CoA binding domain protein n=2 Tax=Meiothermus taiwanensis TaxID=172827 RepID=A0A399E881_9DEIN|nr:CoA-binding protein [Meiothermus taiwanensis]AWR85518.1 putative CoA-binding protein [Meiothermus taiwanensis WR-220]KIQ55672.1 CoA-binding protein [Meiothermus taiwanensis]RIH80118.1 CoA binding domain protein [Meiothermus taiwanensis]
MENLREFLLQARTIAVLGAHPNPAKAAFYVPDYLARRGYAVLPVNPAYAGQVLWGRTVVGRLSDLDGPIDIVNVFRRSEVLMGHLDELLATRPKMVWLQSGIVNDAFADSLRQAGVEVVQNRCLMVVHRQLLG